LVRGAAELSEAGRLSGDDRYAGLARQRSVENYESLVLNVQAQFEAIYFAARRKAGVPQE
jgi:hypothetical protein